MKGAVYYSEAEALRNQTFIADVQQEAQKIGIELDLRTTHPTGPLDFVLFRDRNPLVARELEQSGYRLFNRSAVQEIANDKYRTFELATMLGIPAVQTFRPDKQLPPLPFVLKTKVGHGGSEVFLCHTEKDVEEVCSRFDLKELIAQPFIESNAQDVRVFMLGDEILGAVKRTGPSDSFKSNFTLGGSVEKYMLNAAQTNQVQTIARAIRSDYIGIDFLLPLEGGWLLNEIEDPVGARSLYATHDFSVAEKLMCYIKERLEV
ncbi:ATP-grasp domain-containing protein [Sporosarcina aquimarina]|uniref:ATP-grasp domain-containing protein n=1 Tax=Sporosarcina aquimarina TaxID=114975 RepID=UPI001C8F174E|nr:alpha-L-glutamate ligase [Sporosarcina aquimarina]MBY0222508.1 alpha-L-glutamate ligase [Sporosarcina aquimarina]